MGRILRSRKINGLRKLHCDDYRRNKLENCFKDAKIPLKNKKRKQELPKYKFTNIQSIDLDDSIYDVESDLDEEECQLPPTVNVPKFLPSNTESDSIHSEEWQAFNTYAGAPNSNSEDQFVDLKKEWVSATRVKNYLLNDPILDWLELNYLKSSVDTSLPLPIQTALMNNKRKTLDENINPVTLLFEMGYKFEDEVINY